MKWMESERIGDERPTEAGRGIGVPTRSSVPSSRSRRRVILGFTLAATILMLSSAWAGLAQASSGYTISVTGLKPQNTTAGVGVTLNLNISGGRVDATHPYTLYWFFGRSNASAISAQIQTVSAPGCVLSTPCSLVFPDSIVALYYGTGSYDVSVTVYDANLNYTIATDVVNVWDQVGVCVTKAPTVLNETQNFTLYAMSWPNPYDAFSWDFGDGNVSSGTMVATGPCKNDAPHNKVVHSYADPGTHMVTLTVWGGDGASARKFIFINVTNVAPKIVNLTVPTSGLLWGSNQFWAGAYDPNNNDEAQNLSFAWNFGDGTPLTISGVYLITPGHLALTTVTHAYSGSGTFTVTVQVYDEEGNATLHPLVGGGQALSGTIKIKNPFIVSGNCTWRVAVGITDWVSPFWCWGIPWWNAAYNATYASGPEKSIGLDGRLPSFSYGPGSVSAYLNSTVGGASASGTAHPTYTDVAPIVGVTSTYVQPTFTLTIPGGPCSFNTITAVLMSGAQGIASGTLTCGETKLILGGGNLYLGNPYFLNVTYSPNGQTGSVQATLTVSYAGGSNGPYVATHKFNNSLQQSFLWSTNVMAVSIGQPVSLTTQIFSYAATSLTTTWTFGDGSSTQWVSAAPPATGPTLLTHTVTHVWAAGNSYTIGVATVDPVVGTYGGLSGVASLHLTDTGSLTINDTALTVHLSGSTTVADATPLSLSASVSDVAPFAQSGSIRWFFGDNNSSSGNSILHTFPGPGTYVVTALATTRGGSHSLALAMVTVVAPKPVARAFCTPTSTLTGSPVVCSGVKSTDGNRGPTSLAFLWRWGDGAVSAGPFPVASTVTHLYTSAAAFTVNLTVTDPFGHSASTTVVINVSAAPTAKLSSVTVTADHYTKFNVTLLSTIPAKALPFVNVTWNWGGWGGLPYTPNGTTGIVVGHTYFYPGSYTFTATVKSPYTTTTIASATVKVVDVAPLISFPYYGSIDYGENHTARYRSVVWGGWADLTPTNGSKWKYNWGWGDGTANSTLSSVSPIVNQTHMYTLAGPVYLILTVTTPQPAGYSTTGRVNDSVTLIPDYDGDGLPNAFEKLVTNTSMYYSNTPSKQTVHGTGLDDYLEALFNGVLGNASADPDRDGLTTAQEILGSVTGYTSNPLETSTAGDGIPDGAHRFSDSFTSTRVAMFNSTVDAYAPVTNVSYGGDAVGFNSSVLTVEMATATGNLSSLSVSVTEASGRTIFLSSPPNNQTMTYYLLNSSPVYGVSSPYGITLSDFATKGTWTVRVSTGTNAVGGNVTLAAIANTYYTNPNLADPFHQGMLTGHTLTVAVYNCSESKTSNYTSFSWSSLSATKVYYWPYSYTYYKLSVLQGVPYYAGWNSTLSTNNSNSPGCPTGLPGADFGNTATYYGDQDFGITPWNAHAAGDARLTNGMKALGSAEYKATAWQYETTAGVMASVPGSNPYPTDPLTATTTPLDPTALSSSGSGIADSVAPNPYSPLVLGVTIYSWNDPACITSTSSFPDVVATYLTGSQSSGKIYTPGSTGSGGSSSLSCVTPYATGMSFGFNSASYILPLDNSQSTWTVEFDLIHVCLASTQQDDWVQLSGSITSTSTVWTSSGANANISAQVIPLSRMPTILDNSSGELRNLPGYGPRYYGEQRFYSMYVNVGSITPGSYGPFQPGMNAILESRTAFLESPFSSWLNSNSLSAHGLSCLGSTNFTTRADNSSQTGSAGTFSVDLSSTPACALTLLESLNATNGTGVMIGRYQALTTAQVDLLGLNAQTTALVPFMAPSGFQSQQGSAPSGFLQTLVGAIGAFFARAWVAFTNFLATCVQYAEQLGQWILGQLGKAAGAIAHAVGQFLQDLNYLWYLIEAGIKWLVQEFINGVSALLAPMKSDLIVAADSLAYDLGYATYAQYNLTLTSFGPRHVLSPSRPSIGWTAPLSSSAALLKIAFWIGAVLAAVAGIWAGILAAQTAAAAATAGVEYGLGYALEYVANEGVSQGLWKWIAIVGSVVGTITWTPIWNKLFAGKGVPSSLLTAIGVSSTGATILSAVILLYQQSVVLANVQAVFGNIPLVGQLMDQVGLSIYSLVFTLLGAIAQSKGYTWLSYLALGGSLWLACWAAGYSFKFPTVSTASTMLGMPIDSLDKITPLIAISSAVLEAATL